MILDEVLPEPLDKIYLSLKRTRRKSSYLDEALLTLKNRPQIWSVLVKPDQLISFLTDHWVQSEIVGFPEIDYLDNNMM